MEEQVFHDDLAHPVSRDQCANCNKPEVVPGFATPLCPECRQLFIKYPIPFGIKFFAGGILVIILVSLYKFPENLSFALHQERGKEAALRHNYITVKKEFDEVLQRNPSDIEAKGYLMLAAFYNEDYDLFNKYSKSLDGVEIDNDELLNKINYTVEKFENYYPDDELYEVMHRADSIQPTLPDTALKSLVQKNPRNVLGLFTYASQLYGVEDYTACDSVLMVLFKTDQYYTPALRLMASSKRQTEDQEASIKYCQQLIDINHESAYGYAYMARTLLKQKKDTEALYMAKKSMSFDDKLPYNIATLALAYHFNNDVPKRDALLKEWKPKIDSSDTDYYQYVMDVIDQKETFRN